MKNSTLINNMTQMVIVVTLWARLTRLTTLSSTTVVLWDTSAEASTEVGGNTRSEGCLAEIRVRWTKPWTETKQ